MLKIMNVKKESIFYWHFENLIDVFMTKLYSFIENLQPYKYY